MLDLFTRFGGRANAGDTDYPNGSFKDETSEGADDGTPVQKDWPNEFRGFAEALVKLAGLTISGNVETADASDIADALLQNGIIGNAAINDLSLSKLTDGATNITSGDFTLQIAPGQISITDSSRKEQFVVDANSLSVDFDTAGNGGKVSFENGGLRFQKYPNGGGSIKIAKGDWSIALPTPTSAGGFSTFNLSPAFSTGMDFSTDMITQARLRFDDGVSNYYSVNADIKAQNVSDVLEISEIKIITPSGSPVYNSSRLVMEYEV